jgi:ubiquinone/menaquinone biosynthesis C-methylase UbiE
VPSDDHVVAARAVYDKAALTYSQFVGTEINAATEAFIDRSLLLALVELLRGSAGGVVADIGCGTGRVAAFMVEHGFDVIGVDVSRAMLGVARAAHPNVRFEEGQLDALPIKTELLAGAVCWYSIIHTPPDLLGGVFSELTRVLAPGGYLLLAFQAESEPIHRADAFGTSLPMTSYRHGVRQMVQCLEEAGFGIYVTVLRAPDRKHETTPQGFIIAKRS